MAKITVMDENLANKIAAGEVIEKTMNVVKELVENSIDAGSTDIKIILQDSGVKEVTVIDDGAGMDKDDAIRAFLRHATSKIKNLEDLFYVNSLGFRGEALPSIASVSHLEMKTSNGKEGTEVIIEGGDILEVNKSDLKKGTRITVTKLFYNTPVRLKYLKNLYTELANITDYINRMALSFPNIKFMLSNNDKVILNTDGKGNLLKVISNIYGVDVVKKMIEVKGSNDDCEITGYISYPELARTTKNNMIILVNGRSIKNSEINRTILDCYHTYIPMSKAPIVVLNIDIDPILIDVNVHPTKQDIKFSKMDSLLDLVYNTIKDTLNTSNNTFKPYQEESYKPDRELNYNYVKEDNNDYELNDNLYEEKHIEEVRLIFDDDKEEIKYNEEEIKRENTLIKPVGLALGTFLIAQDEDTMYMFDIHAADERYNYERIVSEMENKKTYITNMLFPLTLEYPHNEFMVIKDHIEDLTSIGLDVKEFGKNTFRVSAHPSWIKEGYEDECIKKIFDIVLEQKDKFDRVKFNDNVAASVACKSSVKANTNISPEEQERIIKNLFTCKFPYTCPHGRPTHIKYPLYELEKMFKRVNFSKVDNEV